MSKKQSKLEIAQKEAQEAIQRTNQRIQILGEHSGELYKALVKIQEQFDKIRNIPSEQAIQLQQIKEVRLNWKKQAEKIENDFNTATKKAFSGASTGILAGIGVAALGPTAAMGVATTFGVASTGTAISALSGAAATNAALAWLGGGALAAGGGGMAAGEAFLAMAGPVGWAIAGTAILASGIFYFVNKNKNERLQNIFTLISKRDVKSYELAIVELNERIERIKDEIPKLYEACAIITTFGYNYQEMTVEQKYTLGAYVNLMLSSTQLLTNPIMGLQPKYTRSDFNTFVESHEIIEVDGSSTSYIITQGNKIWVRSDQLRLHPEVIISLANLLYSIEIDHKDQELLYSTFKKNKEFLKSFNMTKAEFDYEILMFVNLVLIFQAEQKQSTGTTN